MLLPLRRGQPVQVQPLDESTTFHVTTQNREVERDAGRQRWNADRMLAALAGLPSSGTPAISSLVRSRE
jgi:hypothetical protein